MQRADVLVYDRLVSAEVLSMARRDAERSSSASGAAITACRRTRSTSG
jgi:siroheme synthase